jgi:hypothetical protein
MAKYLFGMQTVNVKLYNQMTIKKNVYLIDYCQRSRFADWLKLREEYRIVGALIGCLAHLPRQDSFLGLPMVLLPEEVTLLLEQKVARLVSFSSLACAPSNDIREKFQEYRKCLYKEQVGNINYIVKL